MGYLGGRFPQLAACWCAPAFRLADRLVLRLHQLTSGATAAAEQGEANARYNLGVMYGTGQGVSQDYVQAHMWFNLAASNAHDEAINDRERVAARMTPVQIVEAQRLALEWKPKPNQALTP